MATKKTLNQILKQNTFSGADVGKALILNTIEKVTERKNSLSENELDTMINNLSNQKQRVIYNAYSILNQYLDDFYKLSQASLQQYFNGRGSLVNAIHEVFTAQKGYRRYLHLPLVLTEKEYSELRADAVKNYENRATDLYTIILITIADYLTAYRDNKQLPENIKAILDSYKNEKIKIEIKDEISETVTIKEMSKLEALDLSSEDFLEYYSFISRDKITADLQQKYFNENAELYNFFSRDKIKTALQQEFINTYTELYNATKDILSKGYKQLKTLKDSELLTVKLTNKEQVKAGIIKPLTENELKDETRKYFINLEPANTEDFIKIQKAYHGGIAIINGEDFSSYDKEILNEYSKAPFNGLLPEGLNPQIIDIYINNIIKPALIAIYGVNALLNVYGELFKVDLSPLKQEDIFTSQIEAYNELVYLSYENINGTPEQVESDRITFKQIFKTINVNECKPTTEQIDALKRELEALPIIDTLKLDYFSQLLQGANIRYDK